MATQHIRDQEVRQAAEVIENSGSYGPYLYTSAPTPHSVRYTFRDRVFLGRKELLDTAAMIISRQGVVDLEKEQS